MIEVKTECPMDKWILDLQAKNGGNKYLEASAQLLIEIDKKGDRFWKNLNDGSFYDFKRSLKDKWVDLAGVGRVEFNCYELVDGYLALGKELLIAGKRREAKVAFLRVFNERIIAEKCAEHGNVFYKGYPEHVEEIYVKYGKGKEDGDFKEIM